MKLYLIISWGQGPVVTLRCYNGRVPVWDRSDAESIRLVSDRYWHRLVYQRFTVGYWGQSVSRVHMNNTLSVYLYHLYLRTSKWWSPCNATALWVGIGLEVVWCREHRTGSFPVLASWSVLTGYRHVPRPISFMSFSLVKLSEIWVKLQIYV